MKITKISVGIVKNAKIKNLVGMASVVIDDVLVLKDLKILDGSNGLFIGYPSRKAGDEYKDIYYFAKKEWQEAFKAKIIEAYIAKLESTNQAHTMAGFDDDMTPVDDGEMPF